MVTGNQESMKMDQEKNEITIAINTKLYDKDVIFSAAYVFLDAAYIMLDGDPEKEILVRIRPKKDQDLRKLGMDFSNELINYSVYKKRAEKNAPVRQAMVQRALVTNMQEEAEGFDDPEGIAVPWEEKYGKKN